MSEEEEMGIYKVHLESEMSWWDFNVMALSIDEATDKALDYGQGVLGFDPKDWDEITVQYVGKAE
jgi:hypothetical protein